MLDAVESVDAKKVIILPNNGNIIMSARQVQQLTSKEVYVIPTRSMPQGISALIAFNFEADYATNVAAMEAASTAIVSGELTTAIRDAEIDGLSVHNGDIIGLIDDVLKATGTDANTVLRTLLSQMDLPRREVLTLYFGEGVTMEAAQQTSQQITAWYPDLEIEVVNGGQPFYTYIISAE